MLVVGGENNSTPLASATLSHQEFIVGIYNRIF